MTDTTKWGPKISIADGRRPNGIKANQQVLIHYIDGAIGNGFIPVFADEIDSDVLYISLPANSPYYKEPTP